MIVLRSCLLEVCSESWLLWKLVLELLELTACLLEVVMGQM